MMKKLAILIALAFFPLAAHGQLVTSNGLAAYGTLDPPLYGNGSYVGYNAASASEFDFFNVGSGPFYWYELNSGAPLPSASMTLVGNTLTVTNLAGNASTASALSATPTQCSYPGQMTGIQANGNANCTSTLQDEYNSFSGCSFATDGANLTCTNTVTLVTAMPDTSYIVMCTEYQSPSVTTPVLGTITYTITSTTQYTITETTQGSSAEWSVSNSYGKSYVCHAHHN